MTTIFTRWFRRNFSNPATVVLTTLLILGFVIILTLGDLIAPILWAIVIAYLLEALVKLLMKLKLSRLLSVIIVFSAFVGVSLMVIFGLIPLIWKQGSLLLDELPNITLKAKEAILALPEKYPTFISKEQVTSFFTSFNNDLGSAGEVLLSASFNSLLGVAAFMVYMVLVPLLVFFFLKDRRLIIEWCGQWLPTERQLAQSVWSEVNHQIGNYVRGKVVEMLIVGLVSYIAFALLELNYALLLGVCVGFSVLIPYIGAALVTIPVALIAFFQWGFSTDFYILMAIYMVIQILDGNVLVPLIFSEATNLHPVAIIGAILLFGGVWGFWGVFFAIPLAILVNAFLAGLKRSREDEEPSAEKTQPKELKESTES